MLTAHKGKGQEFDWVFVIGLEEGVISDFRTMDQDSLTKSCASFTSWCRGHGTDSCNGPAMRSLFATTLMCQGSHLKDESGLLMAH